MATESIRGNFRQGGSQYSGAAMKRMQEIALKLYESTPGIEEGKSLTYNKSRNSKRHF